MKPRNGRFALACAAVIALTNLPVGRSASAQTWVGGGASDNWSDPANWDTGQVPQPGPTRSLIFQPRCGTHAISHQDLADPYTVGSLAFRAGAGFIIDGKPILLGGQTPLLQDDSTPGGLRVVRSPLRIEGVVRVRARSEPLGAKLVLVDVSGPGFIQLVTGDLAIGHAIYTGKTNVTGGVLQMGWWADTNGVRAFFPGLAENQADYVIHPLPFSSAGLTGTGTIGMGAGRRIFLEGGGYLAPGYGSIGPAGATLTVNGGVRFGDATRYVVRSGGPGATSLLDVNGLLDLSGQGDVLDLTATFRQSGTVVVAEYDNRIGEFDVFRAAFFDGAGGERATIRYTSEVGEGRGQVLVTVTVPEPGVAVVTGGGAVAFALLRRRSRG